MSDVTIERPRERASSSFADAPPTFRLRREMNGIPEAPGKVWFFELAAAVIDADRCVRCGACVAACPSDSIGLNSEDLPMLVKMCTGCSLCWDFCPRGGLRYEATWLDEEKPNDPGPEDLTAWKIVGDDPNAGLGRSLWSQAAKVKPESPLRSPTAQDGGVVSAILVAALNDGVIDGALVAREDPATPWRGVPFLATTAEEILQAGGSFYNQTLALGALDLESVGLHSDARIALVGTPCEVQGIKALQARAFRRGSSKVDAVVLTIALLCTKSFDYKKLMLDELQERRGLDLAEVAKVDVIHGKMIVTSRAGATLVDESVKEFHSAALKGCDECADFLGRGADISVGSVGSADGYSSVIMRTPEGVEAFKRVMSELETGSIERPESLRKLDALDKKNAMKALMRPLDPDGPLFIDFAEHLEAYGESDREPIWRGW